ncbi:hypothetical protein GCM10010914_00560 [Deinococcus wulumuqiensis]|uniref:Uncharacterized protein n=1 Tax=Deinococcus wulumuqiensis TaxID=980427 RepID=A0AAV4K4M7_9DEIO|nr:hypothetical protein GCM10010914_00560 [Deinococcus wulumuqiensis]GGP29577.1 hypothetical protein GCM10008021_12280 [Deinococcus wulumuqiensis]
MPLVAAFGVWDMLRRIGDETPPAQQGRIGLRTEKETGAAPFSGQPPPRTSRLCSYGFRFIPTQSGLEHLTKRRNVFLASGLGQLAESECKTLSRADLQSCEADWYSSAGENGVMRGAVPRIT